MRFLRQGIYLLALAIGLSISSNPALSQSTGYTYQIEARPDIWYNTVDGIRVGGVVDGRELASIEKSSHQLDLGVWLGTHLPEMPISYYLSLKEPIPAIATLGQEAFVEGISSVRTGYQQHGLGFYKRWKPQRERNRTTSFTFNLFAARRFEVAYLQYPQTWQEEWITASTTGLTLRDLGARKSWQLSTRAMLNFPLQTDWFARFKSTFIHTYRIGNLFRLNKRVFLGIATSRTAPEYQWIPSMASPIHWNERGLFRARGTMPSKWMRSGQVQPVGGPHLRGYTDRHIQQLNAGIAPLIQSIGAVNLEFEFPNPVNRALKNVPTIHKFTRVSSYLFWDGGTSLGLTESELDRFLSNAGVGMRWSFNIPDYLHQSRGFFIRYEIPLWLSVPLNEEDAWQIRHLVGFGTVFNF